MAQPIDTRVSPAIHPEGIRSIEGYNEGTAPFVASVVSAFTDAYATIGKMHDAADLWRRNPAVTEEQRILIVGKKAAKQQDRLLRLMDSAQRGLAAAIEHTEGELRRPLTEKAGAGTLNQEVRSYCRGLSAAERGKLLNRAIASGDEPTLAAVLGAQPFLSGLSPEERDHYLHRFNTQKSPHLVARLGLMRGVMEKMDRDATKVMTEMAKAVGATADKVKRIDDANEAAVAALKFEPQA